MSFSPESLILKREEDFSTVSTDSITTTATLYLSYLLKRDASKMIKVIFDKNTLIDAVGPALCAVSERNTL